MKKIYFPVLMILMVSSFYGIQQEVVPLSSNSVNIRINTDINSLIEDGGIDSRGVSHTVALLAEDVEIHVKELKIVLYDNLSGRVQEELFISGSDLLSDKSELTKGRLGRVHTTDSFVFREMYGFTIKTELTAEEGDLISIIESADFTITGTGTKEMPGGISPAFYHSYQALADNFRDSYLANLPFKQEAMLIVTADDFADTLTPFVKWKRQKGFEVTTVNKSDIAINATRQEIKDYIGNFYKQAENKPDYLLLIGCSDNIPPFHYGPQHATSDLPYGLIEGDDYFPEMLVGRISAATVDEQKTITNKIIQYEKEPFIHKSDWMERALVVGGSYSAALPPPVNPKSIFSRISMMLEEAGYEVTEIFWNMGDGGSGRQEIIDALNEGVQLVSAFTWGDANGWHYPRFHISDLSEVQSMKMIPYVTSFVSQTGDFANTSINPCFGEYWMRQGTPGQTNGAVSFLGPSDIYTSTTYGQMFSLAYYNGILREGIRTPGSASLRAIMELYRNFPNDNGSGQWVEHYFQSYNTLSDPSLNLWVLAPEEPDLDIPARISAASSHLQFSAPGMKGGYATVTRDEENCKTFRIDSENVFIPLSAEDERDILITVTAENYLPVQQHIEVLPAEGVVMTSYDFDTGKAVPGKLITMNIAVKNFSDQEITNAAAGFTTFNEEYVDIVEDEHNFGDIAANDTAQGSFTFEVASHTPRQTPLQFAVNISPCENSAKIQTILGGIMITVDDYQIISENDILDPGETASIKIKLTNRGEVDARSIIAEITAGSNAVTVQEEPFELGNIGVGEQIEAAFTATAAADAYVGRQVYFQLDFEDEDELSTVSHFHITLGEVTNTAPTGPCSYGYFAYDSNDKYHAPVYNWIDIDPQNGGPGIETWLDDDETITMDLPFTFGYYGQEFDVISICSNGWVSLQETQLVSFRNYSIPSVINPPGVIAPFWDDLKGKPAAGDSLRIVTYYDADNDHFVISWLDAYNFVNVSPNGLEKFQLILVSPEMSGNINGDIFFQYHTVWNNNALGNHSTTGIQSPCNYLGLQYAFNRQYEPSATPVEAGLAIRFTTEPPDHYTSVEDDTIAKPTAALHKNYPNPFNPETVIEFDIRREGWTELLVYNILGQKVRTLINEHLPAGEHQIVWNGKDDNNRKVSSGVYLYKLKTEEFKQVRRMILIK